MKNRMIISFVGLTHLGLNYLAATAKKKFTVFGFDKDKFKIDKLNDGDIEYDEPRLKSIIRRNKKNITFTNNFRKLSQSKLVFISQDVNTDKNDNSDLKKLKKLIDFTIKFLSKNSKLIILSQSKPGFVRSIKYNPNNLFYQVETLVFGEAIKRATKPERFIIGLDKKENKLDGDYLKYLKKFRCPILKMNYESAEVSKISINLLLASTLTTSNILSNFCENNFANWSDIMPAIKLDRRIGKYSYIKPGLGIGGGNIERDIATAIKLTKKSSSKNFLKSFTHNSRYMKDWVYRLIKNKRLVNFNKKNFIGIIGATYKENTNSMKNSPFLDLIKKIYKNNNITLFEPMIKINFKKYNLNQIENLNELVSKSKIIILMRPFNIKKLRLNSKNLKNKIIIDPYGVFKEKIKNVFVKKYFTLGAYH